MAEAHIGIIGGSGLTKWDTLKDVAEVEVTTPFGAPSDALIFGDFGGNARVTARHGRTAVSCPRSCCRSGLIFMQ